MHPKLTMIVTNSSGDCVDCVKTGVDLLAQKRPGPACQVTHWLPWTQVGEAFELYSTKKDNSLKALIVLG